MTITNHVSQAVLDMAAKAARAAAPSEACGILLSVVGDKVDRLMLSHNCTSGDPTKTFEIAPELLIACQKSERDGGPKVMGVWHSHPNGKAVPSATDKARSEHAGWLWLITAIKSAKIEQALYVAGNDPSDITEFV